MAANKRRSPHADDLDVPVRDTERERVVSAEVPTKAINVSLYLLVAHSHLLKPTESESDRVFDILLQIDDILSAAPHEDACAARAVVLFHPYRADDTAHLHVFFMYVLSQFVAC